MKAVREYFIRYKYIHPLLKEKNIENNKKSSQAKNYFH